MLSRYGYFGIEVENGAVAGQAPLGAATAKARGVCHHAYYLSVKSETENVCTPHPIRNMQIQQVLLEYQNKPSKQSNKVHERIRELCFQPAGGKSCFLNLNAHPHAGAYSFNHDRVHIQMRQTCSDSHLTDGFLASNGSARRFISAT